MPDFNHKWLSDNGLEVARYAFDGEFVWVPLRREDGVWMLVSAKVICAAGNHARVSSEKHGVDRWYDVYDIYRRKDK
jgi:hypothetical protein